MKRLLASVFFAALICSACTSAPRTANDRSISTSSGVSVYGVIDVGVVSNF